MSERVLTKFGWRVLPPFKCADCERRFWTMGNRYAAHRLAHAVANAILNEVARE